jgi:hypothetical protein
MSLLVVTPTLGCSPYLHETVASVNDIKESVPLHHVLACPLQILRDLQGSYPECLVVPDAGPVGGLYGAINAGVRAAPTGWSWLTYINDDDLLQPGLRKVCASHMRPSLEHSVAYGNVRNIDQNGSSLGLQTVERSPRWFRPLLCQGISLFTQQGALISRVTYSHLGGFNPTYRSCGALDFWARALQTGWDFRFYPEEVACFRIRRGQISGNAQGLALERFAILKEAGLPVYSSLHLHTARLRFRLLNVARYVQRLRAVGWKSSKELLGSDSATKP